MKKRTFGLLLKFRHELKTLRFILKDGRTPLLPKLVLAFGVLYLLFPFDFIPDYLPILGQLDELVVIPFLTKLAIKLTPPEVVERAKNRIK